MSMKTCISRITLLLVTACLPFSVHAEGKDVLWEVTSKMEMPGMPMAMPQQTAKVCTPAGAGDESKVPQDKNCKLLESKQTGNKFTYKVECNQDGGKMTGSGEVVSSADSYRGTFRVQGKMEGQAMDMTTNFTGKKIGNCTAGERPKKHGGMQNQTHDSMAQICDQSIGAMTTEMFFGDGAVCKDRQAEFCKQASQITRTAEGYRNYDTTRQGKTLIDKTMGRSSDPLQVCKLDAVAALKGACKNGIDKSDWGFVADYCPGDAVALRQQICGGRSYTSLGQKERVLCDTASAGGGPAYTSKAAATHNVASTQPKEETAPNLADEIKKEAIDQGVNKVLRGIFSF